jgi:DNA gyrase/topoisomerase IV subunit A
MLDKRDAGWWIAEVEKHPETAADLIRMLADRLAFLDKQNEELRAENIALRRRLRGEGESMPSGADVNVLQRRVQELETALRRGSAERRVIIHARDHILYNGEVTGKLGSSAAFGGSRIAACVPAANLLIVTADSRAFSLTLADLPTTEAGPAPLGTPHDVAGIIDKTAFERARFLLLVSQRGVVYSLLAGSAINTAAKQEKLLRNLIPDDPITLALPAHNHDLFAVTARGRWTRFPERAIAPTGSSIIDLQRGDSLAGLVSLPPESTELIIVTAENRLFVRPASSFPARKAPGSAAGMLGAEFKGQTVMGAAVGADLILLTARGEVFGVSTGKYREAARSSAGIGVPGLAGSDSVIAVSGT